MPVILLSPVWIGQADASLYAHEVSSASAAYAVCLSARRRAGLSQRGLAAAAGVSASTIARIEKGRMEPTLALLTRLIDACGFELRLSVAAPASPRSDPGGFPKRYPP